MKLRSIGSRLNSALTEVKGKHRRSLETSVSVNIRLASKSVPVF